MSRPLTSAAILANARAAVLEVDGVIRNKGIERTAEHIEELERRVEELEARLHTVEAERAVSDAVARNAEARAIAAEERSNEQCRLAANAEARATVAESHFHTSVATAGLRERESDKAADLVIKEVEERLRQTRRADLAEMSLSMAQEHVLHMARQLAAVEMKMEDRVHLAEQKATERMRQADTLVHAAEQRTASTEKNLSKVVTEFRRHATNNGNLNSPTLTGSTRSNPGSPLTVLKTVRPLSRSSSASNRGNCVNARREMLMVPRTPRRGEFPLGRLALAT